MTAESVSRIKIRVDHREPREIQERLSADPLYEIEITQLTIGDFDLGKGVVVERKSSNDFAASIVDSRIFLQVASAKEIGVRMIFLLEGDVYSPQRALHPNALMGALSNLAILEGLPVVPSRDANTTVQLIKTFALHNQKGLPNPIRLLPPKPKTLPEQQVALIASIPGLGENKAKALLAQFGSPIAVFSASVEQISKVPGFGAKTAEAIHRVLTSTFR